MKQRILAFLTAFCMVLALLPTHAFADEHSHDGDAAAPSRLTVTGTYINPLYEGVPAPQRLTAPQLLSEGDVDFDPDAYLTETADVVSTIRAGLEQRQAAISVPWRIAQSAVADDDADNTKLKSLLISVVLLAMSHTGVPTQGDYLLWHYAEIGFQADRIDPGTGDFYYLDITFSATYYTTAQQEAELTAELETVIDSFGFTAATGDYDKVKAIYDYVCANVVYDHTNLEDETYTLKYSAYAALMDGTAVCQGYASLLYRMLLTAGVDARVISGDVGGPHGWNIVELGDVYYNLDSTWDAGQSEYDYFLKAPANFTDHTRDEAYDSADFHAAYPMATADYVPEAVHTHTVTPVAAEPATCTEPGTEAHYICSCGKFFSDADATEEVQAADLVIPATGHTEQAVPGTDPTCTEPGLTDGVKCSVCGETLTAQTSIPATGHTWGDWAQTTAPTEDEKGEDTRECSVCHATETRDVPALGHICANHLTAKTAVPATCTEPGTKAHYICSCGKLYTDANAATEVQAADLVVAATGHSEQAVPGTDPTCTDTGLTDGVKCSVCGETLTAQTEIPATGHTYVNGACSVCGAADPGFVPGDFTGDDVLTDDDAIYLLWHTLFPELYPIGSDGDLTGDGVVTDDDAIYLLWHTLFPELYPLYAPATVSTTSDERGKKK